MTIIQAQPLKAYGISGPTSASDNEVLVFDGTTGKRVKAGSGIFIKDGKIGIGVENPVYKLDINGSIGLENGEYITNTENGTIRLGGTGPTYDLNGWIDFKFDNDSWTIQIGSNPEAIVWNSQFLVGTDVPLAFGTKNAGKILYAWGGGINSLNIAVDRQDGGPRGNNVAILSTSVMWSDIGVPVSDDPALWFYGNDSFDNDKTGRLQYVSADDVFVIDSKTTSLVLNPNGNNVGIGTITPTAVLHLKAGTASVAPLKLTAGVNLTTPEAGAIEFDGTNLYLTQSDGTRKTIAFV